MTVHPLLTPPLRNEPSGWMRGKLGGRVGVKVLVGALIHPSTPHTLPTLPTFWVLIIGVPGRPVLAVPCREWMRAAGCGWVRHVLGWVGLGGLVHCAFSSRVEDSNVRAAGRPAHPSTHPGRARKGHTHTTPTPTLAILTVPIPPHYTTPTPTLAPLSTHPPHNAHPNTLLRLCWLLF